MSRTWIIYIKPEDPNSVHAGLLLALGLHGFLRVLSITDIFSTFLRFIWCSMVFVIYIFSALNTYSNDDIFASIGEIIGFKFLFK
jgi:hypothetical protein